MSYSDRLKHWAVVRRWPNQTWVIIARFRSVSDAEGHCQFLQRHIATAEFKVVFDVVE